MGRFVLADCFDRLLDEVDVVEEFAPGVDIDFAGDPGELGDPPSSATATAGPLAIAAPIPNVTANVPIRRP
ncbi:MAG TPA: hypothetical protein VH496_11335 [Mycobacterium sp.]